MESPFAPTPLVLLHTTANRQLVIAACDSARSAGVRPGMSLAQARALCPELAAIDHDPAGDAKALEALGRWMMRFTPVVQVTAQSIHHGLFLDVTGTERLFKSYENLLGQISTALTRFGIRARLAIAPTPGAAWAMTFGQGMGCRVWGVENSHTPNPTPHTLPSELPVHSLRLEDHILHTLHHLGIQTIGQLLRLPREQIPARFGPQLLLRIDQALGRVAEPLTPLSYHAPIDAAIDFDGVVDSLEALWAAFKSLIEEIVIKLIRQGAGARRIKLTFLRPYAATVEKTIDLSAPSRNAATLFNLVRCAMEAVGERAGSRKRRWKIEDGGWRKIRGRSIERFQPKGFTGLRLAVPVFERLSEEQIFLLEQEEHAGRQDLARLIERLRIRLGDEAVAKVEKVESYVPERGWRVKTKDRTSNVQLPTFNVQRKMKHETWNMTKPPLSLSCDMFHVSGLSDCFRPLHLFDRPREIAVMVRPSHDRDGAPVMFKLDGETHAIVHAVGPERIAGEWWTGHDKTRDYFDVEDESGRRWWVFRVTQTNRWFLHGMFE